MHHPPHLAQLLAGRAQELDVLGQLRDAVHLHVVAAQLLGGAALGLALHHLAQLRNALGRKSLGDLLLRRRRLVAVRREQPGQQPPSRSSRAIALSAWYDEYDGPRLEL